MTSEEAEPGGARAAREAGLREITDAQTMRALAHPVRIAILEALYLSEALTATEVGEQIGESPTTCSFHLRQLARYGFVEEAGGGKGRARPWRRTSIGMSAASNPEDPEVGLATSAVLGLMRQRILDRFQTWLETRDQYPAAWRKAASESQFVFWLTARELDELTDELAALLIPRMDRLRDPALRPPGAVPVEMMLLAYPVRLPDTAVPDGAGQEQAGQDGAGRDGAGQ